ncbi:N,N-dimethylformamidase beta subunit family domain-containing protein [Streptosporangium sp. NPDC000396]|uniref:N,N-dimethylformamidase beta subunit family domain-containing protein n=1 Tax=Streptosporangium sp. NPDC000396 TaxID=3366185 RepID=UPI0036B059A9
MSRLGRRGFLGVLAATVVTAGCDGSPAPRGAVAGRSAPVPRTPRPTVLPESLLPGDPGWRIRRRGPDEAIEGYADQFSAVPGEEVALRVSTTGAVFRVTAYRVGWYGGAQARRVWRSRPIRGVRQDRRGRFVAATRTVHADWAVSVWVPTRGWPEGVYLLRLDSDAGFQRYVPLVVRSVSAAGKTLLVHAITTWQAYNRWGGYSLYMGESGSYDTRSLAVTFDRPYEGDGARKFMVHERALVVLAERLGIRLAYTTGPDLHADPAVLDGAASIVFLGHDEYWTPQERRHVRRARDAGSNVAFLGANSCYWRIRLEPTRKGVNRLVVCYKSDAGSDPMFGRRPSLVSTNFRLSPAADPESSLVGVLYDGFPVDAPFVVHSPGHWLFEGAGVKRGDAFAHLVGVEYDRVVPGVPTPRPLEIIAHSPLVCGGRSSFADAGYYTAAGGAGVFASGTMRWVEGLMAGTRDGNGSHGMDARTRRFVTKVTKNLLTGFARGPAGELFPGPKDNVDEVYA